MAQRAGAEAGHGASFESPGESVIRCARILAGRRFRSGSALERLAMAAGVLVVFLVGYFGVGTARHAGTSFDMATPLDRQIPFIAQGVWIYIWVYTAALVPLFVVRCPRLFRRTVLAYLVAIAVSLVCFAAWPTTSAGLRASAAELDFSRPSDWIVGVLYRLDPPYNLFPSLHLCIAMLAAYATWKANKLCGLGVYVGAGLVAGAVCAVKQHVLLDVVGGSVLAVLVAGWIIGPYRAWSADGPPGYGWRGPAAYVGFLLLVYGAIYALYLCSTAGPMEAG